MDKFYYNPNNESYFDEKENVFNSAQLLPDYDEALRRDADERERRERTRTDRIAKSGKNKLIYSLDIIIDKCFLYENEGFVQIDFYDLGFKDNPIDLADAHRFFNKLQTEGCFETVERYSQTFTVTKPDMKKLKEYRAKLEGELGHTTDNEFYITKKCNDFSYKGRYINLSKKSDYYKVFAALYAKLPNGGEVSYKDLIVEIKSRLPKTKEKTYDEMRKFIQRNLTDKSNGFMRYAGIPETEDNGKPLIEVSRGSGIVFNNKAG